jgi:ketosteroid isomerase-like protein
MPSDEEEVLAANEAFYTAFATRDLAAMDALWAQGTRVVCIHPGWQTLSGRGAVMASWRGILENPAAPEIACTQPTAHVLGDAAFVVCTERLPDAQLIATNVFTREGGRWRMVHHHAGPVARELADDRQQGSGELH